MAGSGITIQLPTPFGEYRTRQGRKYIPDASGNVYNVIPGDDVRDLIADGGFILSNIAANLAGLGVVIDTTLSNFQSSTSFPRWRRALANVQAGTSRAKLAFLGDSTFAGAGSGTGGTTAMNGASQNSIPRRVQKMLNGSAGTICRDNFVGGDHANPNTGIANLTLYEPRQTFAGASWGTAGGVCMGGHMLNNSGTDSYTFTPTDNCDRFDIYYYTHGTFGTFTVTDGSGTLATINTAAADAIGKTTVSRASASNAPINLQRNGTGGGIYIAAIDGWNSTSPSVDVLNLGTYGLTAVTTSATVNAYDIGYALPAIAPNLTIIHLGINDCNTGVSIVNYTAAMQSLITSAQISGDVLLIGSWYNTSTGSSPIASQQAFGAARLALAQANNCPYLDIAPRFGGMPATATYFYYDNVHLLAPGYADVASAIYDVIRPR